LTKLKVSQ